MDCFVASLLAMTADTVSYSRGAMRLEFRWKPWCHEQFTERRASCARCKRIFFREDTMSFKNIAAAIVIVAVVVGGGFAIYKLDDGRGARTSRDVSVKTASD
jgi:hypothetical protein